MLLFGGELHVYGGHLSLSLSLSPISILDQYNRETSYLYQELTTKDVQLSPHMSEYKGHASQQI